MTAYVHTFEVRWSDVDANRHLRNSSYCEYATHTRWKFLASEGFDQKYFEKLQFGPVIFREEILYKRELGPDDTVTVDFQIAGMNADFSRWKIRQHFKRADGQLCAIINLEGSWFDLKTRKLMAPPAEVSKTFAALTRTEDYADIAKS